MIAPVPEPARPVFQIKITLKDSRPPIWRRVLVPGDFTLAQLHQIIQAVMPWQECHLHEFRIRDACYGRPDLEERDDDLFNEKNVRLTQVLKSSRKFQYRYDFGDDWDHTLEVEKRLPREPGVRYPVCLAGANACPPEDSGSLWGYYEKLDILKDPKHPAHAETRDWMPAGWNPARFVLAEINQTLKTLDKQPAEE